MLGLINYIRTARLKNRRGIKPPIFKILLPPLVAAMALPSAFRQRLEQMEQTRIQRISLLQVKFESYLLQWFFFSFLRIFCSNYTKFTPLLAGRERTSDFQISSASFKAIKYQINGAAVFKAWLQDCFAAPDSIFSQFAASPPGIYLLHKFSTAQVITKKMEKDQLLDQRL